MSDGWIDLLCGIGAFVLLGIVMTMHPKQVYEAKRPEGERPTERPKH